MPDQQQALDALLPQEEQTGDLRTDLIKGLQRALQIRIENSRNGGQMVEGLRALGLSWREIEADAGLPQSTARRWADRPG